jgi:hypothetical protein
MPLPFSAQRLLHTKFVKIFKVLLNSFVVVVVVVVLLLLLLLTQNEWDQA